MLTIVCLLQVTCLSIMCSVQTSFEMEFQLQAVLVYNLNVFSVNTIFSLQTDAMFILPVLKS